MKEQLRKTALFTGLAVIFCLFAAPVTGDEIILKNGNSLEGIVTKKGDQYKIEFPSGTMTVPVSEVERVVKSTTTLETFRKRHRNLDKTDAEAHFNLARWADRKGLRQQARREYRHTINLNPDHGQARKHLGYKKHNGEWMTPNEIMRDKGYVKYEGEWVTPEVKQARIALKEKKKLERERKEELSKLRDELEASRQEIRELRREVQSLRYEQRNRRYNTFYHGSSFGTRHLLYRTLLRRRNHHLHHKKKHHKKSYHSKKHLYKKTGHDGNYYLKLEYKDD